MFYTRGSEQDFNRYAALTADPGWSWDQILPYFFKASFVSFCAKDDNNISQNEKWTPPADHHNTQGQFDPAVHSTTGINSVSLNGFQWPLFQHNVLQTTQELPDEFPLNPDGNSGKPLGLGMLSLYRRQKHLTALRQ